MLCGKERGGRGKELNSVSFTVNRRNRNGHVSKEECRSRILLISSYGMELLLGTRRKREKGPPEDLEVTGCGAMAVRERVRSCHGCCPALPPSLPPRSVRPFSLIRLRQRERERELASYLYTVCIYLSSKLISLSLSLSLYVSLSIYIYKTICMYVYVHTYIHIDTYIGGNTIMLIIV